MTFTMYYAYIHHHNYRLIITRNIVTILDITMTRYWTYVKEEKVNCFLKGGKAETVRKPKYVSGSISKVLYYSYHVSKLDLC